jgi:hypothetical protein
MHVTIRMVAFLSGFMVAAVSPHAASATLLFSDDTSLLTGVMVAQLDDSRQSVQTDQSRRDSRQQLDFQSQAQRPEVRTTEPSSRDDRSMKVQAEAQQDASRFDQRQTSDSFKAQ